MELEFDKEIDALLRKAGKSGEAAAPVLDSHLDADEISMFAENAAPEAARSRMIVHFADCDRCRTILSNVVALNLENPVAEQTESVVPLKNEVEGPSSLAGWFSTRNLAFGFGALALVFAGFMGFAVIRNMTSGPTELAQADQKESNAAAKVTEAASNTTAGAPVMAESESANTNSEQLVADPASPEAPLAIAKNNAITGKDVARRQETDNDGFSGARSDLGRMRDSADKRTVSEVREETMDDSMAAEGKRAARQSQPAPPPPAKPSASVLTTRGAVEKKKEDERAVSADEEVAADAVAPADQNKRQVSGRTFNKRNGIWYDSSYRNEPTTNVRRGTSNYRSLDAGVRSIADQLPGTIVVVWKTKAYKIQ